MQREQALIWNKKQCEEIYGLPEQMWTDGAKWTQEYTSLTSHPCTDVSLYGFTDNKLCVGVVQIQLVIIAAAECNWQLYKWW